MAETLTILASQLTANDQGNNLVVASVTSPTLLLGTAVLEGQTITYTPPSASRGANGAILEIVDQFNYTIRNSAGLTSTAAVYVTVKPNASLPLGSNVTVTTQTLLGFCPPNAELVGVGLQVLCEATFYPAGPGYGASIAFFRTQGDASVSGFELLYRVAGVEGKIFISTPLPVSTVDPNVPEADGRYADGGYARRVGTRTFSPDTLVSTIYPLGTRIRVIQFDIEFTEDRPNVQVSSTMTIADLLVELNRATFFSAEFNGVLSFRVGTGHYDIIYREPGFSGWNHADQLFTVNAPTRSSFSPFPNVPSIDTVPVPGQTDVPLAARSLRITLAGTVGAPIAQFITYDDILANVTKPPGTVVTLDELGSPSFGTLERGVGFVRYVPPIPAVEDSFNYYVTSSDGQASDSAVYLSPPSATTPGGSGLGRIVQFKSIVTDSTNVVPMTLATTRGNLLIAVASSFYTVSPNAADGWTTFFSREADVRDSIIVAYKVADGSTNLTPFSQDTLQGTTTVFELPAAVSGMGAPFAALDIVETSISRTTTLNEGAITIGVAVGVGGIAPTVTGGGNMTSVTSFRSAVQPFFSETSSTITATVPASQGSQRFLFLSMNVALR